MSNFLRGLIVMVLVSIGAEFVAPLLTPAHACASETHEATVAVSAPCSSRDCHHHSPICEISTHAHSAAFVRVNDTYAFAMAPEISSKPIPTDDSAPSSPHLSGLKRPPIARA